MHINIINITIYIWEFDFIWKEKLKKKEQKDIDKKTKILNQKIDEIINFRFDKEQYNNYKLQMLLKDLKKLLYTKIATTNDDILEDCIKHLFYLIKKWKGYDKSSLNKWIFITIEKYKN